MEVSEAPKESMGESFKTYDYLPIRQSKNIIYVSSAIYKSWIPGVAPYSIFSLSLRIARRRRWNSNMYVDRRTGAALLYT